MSGSTGDPVQLYLRKLVNGAPFFLPLLAVLGCLYGGNGWVLSLAAFVLAHLLRCRRVLIAICLCTSIAWVHSDLLRHSAADLNEALRANGSVELEGTVVRRLAKGCILHDEQKHVRVVVRGNIPWNTGDRIRVVAEEQPTHAPLVPGMFDTAEWMRSQGLAANLRMLRGEYLELSHTPHTIIGFAESLRKHLTANLISPDTMRDARRQVLCALVLGDKEPAEPETLNIFKRGGCMHAFAVSGLHVGIVAGMVYVLAFLTGLSPRVRSILTLIIVGVYVLITGLAVPALRAYLMIALALVGLELRRRVSMLNILSFAALLILLYSPWQLYNAGFVLSFSVYAGIGIGVRLCMQSGPWFAADAYLPRRLYTPWQRRVAAMDAALRGTVIVSLSAWLISVPVTLAFFHTVTPWSYLTNIAISPLLPLVLGSGLLTSVAGGIPLLGEALRWVALQSSGLLIGVTQFFAGLPMSYVPYVDSPRPHDALVCHLGYGESCTVLGNPGVVIGCGTASTSYFSTDPLLFFSGYSPFVLVKKAGDSGENVLQQSWPQLQVYKTTKGVVRFTTSAGTYTVYPPMESLSAGLKAGGEAIVHWESEQGNVLYLGSCDALTFRSIPESVVSAANVVIIGHNNFLPIDLFALYETCRNAHFILLPEVPEDVAATLPGSARRQQVSESVPLIRFTPRS